MIRSATVRVLSPTVEARGPAADVRDATEIHTALAPSDRGRMHNADLRDYCAHPGRAL